MLVAVVVVVVLVAVVVLVVVVMLVVVAVVVVSGQALHIAGHSVATAVSPHRSLLKIAPQAFKSASPLLHSEGTYCGVVVVVVVAVVVAVAGAGVTA